MVRHVCGEDSDKFDPDVADAVHHLTPAGDRLRKLVKLSQDIQRESHSQQAPGTVRVLHTEVLNLEWPRLEALLCHFFRYQERYLSCDRGAGEVGIGHSG